MKVLRRCRSLLAIGAVSGVLAAILAFAAVAASVNAPAATGGAATDTAALQSVLDSVPATGGVVTVNVPAGTYSTNDTLRVASNTILNCAPGAIFKPVPPGPWVGKQPFGVSNQHNTADTPTDHDITIENCTVDFTNHPGAAGHHAFYFRSASAIHIIRPSCPHGPGDCTAMVHTDNTWVQDGNASGMLNACWDHWHASTNMHVIGGKCRSSLYGVLITGTNTNRTDAGVSSHGVIEGGIYTIDFPGPSNGGAGIWVNGLGRPGSGSSHVHIHDPTINLGGSTTTGIKVSGAGSDVTIDHPLISGTTRNSVIITGADSGGTETGTVIKDATFNAVRVGPHALVTLNGINDAISGSAINGGSFTEATRIGRADHH